MNTTQATAGGLNKVENANSTITLKDLKATSPSPILSIHPSLLANNNSSNSNHSSSDVDVNDENAPSNFPVENVTNNSDKVIYDGPYERPLTSIHLSSPSTHHLHSQHHHNGNLTHVVAPTLTTTKIEGEMETDYALQHTYPTVHKSIHHTTTTTTTTATHYRGIMVDENLENKQQNSVNEEDDVWRPW